MRRLSEDLTRTAVETAMWCKVRLGSRVDPMGLRSIELRPSRELVTTDLIDVKVADRSLCIGIVGEVAIRRRRLLKENGWVWNGERIEDQDGRLLIFHHDLTLSDGGAADLSGGLFDSNNQPPWDTWIGYLEESDSESSGLVSWVPGSLMKNAENGIYANPERSLEWL
jgi:hypothetical protein